MQTPLFSSGRLQFAAAVLAELHLLVLKYAEQLAMQKLLRFFDVHVTHFSVRKPDSTTVYY